ncbi:hypothetical protein ACQKP0_25295 [Heyndrickxia sp. NPDC080065]|uniref:hypothetical protein n=1 Tax=Heyndrickxia sp. NPDC080065 TaxID=3390568 RepID=UPI003CFE70D5
MYQHHRPIVCKPRYVVSNSYMPRVVPFIHPVINIHRRNIVNVPRHIYQPINRSVVYDPGYPTHCPRCRY